MVADERRHAETLTTLMADCLLEAGWDGADWTLSSWAADRACSPGCASEWRRLPRTAMRWGFRCTECAVLMPSPPWRFGERDAVGPRRDRRATARGLLGALSTVSALPDRGVIAPAVLVDELAGEQIDLVAGCQRC